MKQTVVRSTYGLGKDLLENKRKYNVMLGMSVGKQFFSNENIKTYANWANEYSKNFIVLVLDHPEAYNRMVFGNTSKEETIRRVTDHGKQLTFGFKRTLSSFDQERIKVEGTMDLFKNPEFIKINHLIYKAYAADKTFKEDVIKQIHLNLDWKLKPWKETVSSKEYNNGIKILANFVLEELAIFLYYGQIYEISIYPGEIMQVHRNIYDEKYDFAKKLITDEFGYIQLDIEEK